MTIQIKNDRATVGIQDGELVSYVVDGHEFIHQKGSPGWGSSDTEMFPIIGPLDKVDFRIMTPKGEAIQDQHGHLRQLPYELGSHTEDSAPYIKRCQGGTRVANSRYPDRSKERRMDWASDLEFEKAVSRENGSLDISVKISGEQGMPFMLGYHPAFKLYTKAPLILADDRKITLEEVLAVGGRALQIEDCTVLTLRDKRDIRLETEGFGHFMCWTEVGNMVCLEPITFYPYAVEQRELRRGFQTLEGPFQAKVTLRPGPG